jgi:hypothetical protein
MAKQVARCLEAFSCDGKRFAEGDAFDPEIYSPGIRDILIREGKIEIEEIPDDLPVGVEIATAVADSKPKKGKH